VKTQLLICCGSGGVGKTTVSAGIAIKAARDGQRVCVLTIDPARRLADSLGVAGLGNVASPVPVPGATGQLFALMLDARAVFDDLVRRFAPSPLAAERILANRYYRFASSRLGGSHEYMAMEKLLELAQSGQYDTIVLDTPPTRNALDFLRAPERMSGLMDQGVLRWLVMPASHGGWRALELGSEALAGVLKKMMGRETVEEISEFFDAFRDLWDGFRDRSAEVQATLRGPLCRFYLVSSPAAASQAEALFFLDVLRERKLPFGGFIVNRVVPAPQARESEVVVPASAGLPEAVQAALRATLRQRAALAADHARSIAHLRAVGPADAPLWVLPDQERDLHDVERLLTLADYLP
jgi:anion-transporting  ArsA/GET3 family ATPase